MPIYQAEFSRHVSRLVSLRQTTFIRIEAPDLMTANDAAHALARDDDELEKHIVEWSDDDGSRQSTNDDVDRRPMLDRAFPLRPGQPVYGDITDAVEILNLDPNDYKDA